MIKELRPLFHDYRLGSVVYTLLTLAAEYAGQLLKTEPAGCDCTSDRKNGLYRCTSDRHHAVNEVVIIEPEEHRNAKQR